MYQKLIFFFEKYAKSSKITHRLNIPYFNKLETEKRPAPEILSLFELKLYITIRSMNKKKRPLYS